MIEYYNNKKVDKKLIEFAEFLKKNYEDLKIFSPEWQVLRFMDSIDENKESS